MCPDIQNFYGNSSVYLHRKTEDAWAVFVGELVDRSDGIVEEKYWYVTRFPTLLGK